MVKETNTIPDKGDIVWLDFNPGSGHEQKGRRPALCVSPAEYNRKTSLGLFCPVTSKTKNYPFEVAVNEEKISGNVLSDQIKCLDWTKRSCRIICKASDYVLETTIENIMCLLNG